MSRKWLIAILSGVVVLVGGVVLAYRYKWPFWSNIVISAKPFIPNWCTCYTDGDCPDTQYCKIPGPQGCVLVRKPGKNFDLKCAAASTASGQVRAEVLASAVSTWFDAYLRANDQGHPDPELVKRAQAFSMPRGWHEEIEAAVVTALDLVLGFDLMRDQTREKELIALMPVPLSPAAIELVTASRDGLSSALRENNPERVAAPLEAFWSQHPDFKPMHTGRCYPHGHPEITNARDCQIEGLKRMATVLLAVRTPQTTRRRPAD